MNKELKKLFSLDNICPKIIYLDLSKTGLTDEGMNVLNENISKLKAIEQIYFENNKLSDKGKEYLTQLEQKKIKIILKIKPIKNKYNIMLGGSTFAGKTTYFQSYFEKRFIKIWQTTIGIEKKLIKSLNDVKFFLYDCSRWGDRFDGSLKNFIRYIDGIILLFDLSNKEDFESLPKFLKMITEFHEMEDFPVLLIGNKSDLDNQVDKEEINNFLEKENFIGYFEVSCKILKNVEESINFMVDYIYEKEKKFPI